ncbi:helix-turn-helix transcriptional regulator [Pedobacter jamesrossensis]|uniref:Helix-turn-helix transcriptional regulator n=1 Tax=Pedobacter jamesrossensis TaxID=1908238 RepID=A0ABV8NTC1_9SPHI
MIIAVGAAIIVLNTINEKLGDISSLATNIEHSQLEPEKILLLIHEAEGDFQESLVRASNKKYADYNVKLSKVFLMIDTLLKERTDTSQLNTKQVNKVKFWYHQKSKLSDKLFVLKHSFDSLLTIYANFNKEASQNLKKIDVNSHKQESDIKSNADTILKVVKVEKKSFFKRIKDAISNKDKTESIKIINNKNTHVTDSYNKNIAGDGRKEYLRKLQQLQRENEKLLTMQGELIVLNSHISNELQSIISNLKDINYKMIDEFKVYALKNYKETTTLLNKFYLGSLFLVVLFAVLLIIFIVKLNDAEILLRTESAMSIERAHQKINDLVKKAEINNGAQSPAKTEELKDIVQLAVENNPAFFIKFNEFDTEFSKKLLSIAPNLIAAEVEFCALLRLNFETKEIARYTKSSVRAVEGKKYRIRKKIGIPSVTDLNMWMAQI